MSGDTCKCVNFSTIYNSGVFRGAVGPWPSHLAKISVLAIGKKLGKPDLDFAIYNILYFEIVSSNGYHYNYTIPLHN